MSGLFENYTNHAIKSSYIPVIENICLEAVRKAQIEAGRNSPLLHQRRQVSRTDSGIGEGSVCSDVKDNHPDDLDDPKDGEILFFSFFNLHIFLITAVKHNFIW